MCSAQVVKWWYGMQAVKPVSDDTANLRGNRYLNEQMDHVCYKFWERRETAW